MKPSQHQAKKRPIRLLIARGSRVVARSVTVEDFLRTLDKCQAKRVPCAGYTTFRVMVGRVWPNDKGEYEKTIYDIVLCQLTKK